MGISFEFTRIAIISDAIYDYRFFAYENGELVLSDWLEADCIEDAIENAIHFLTDGCEDLRDGLGLPSEDDFVITNDTATWNRGE